MRIGAIAFQPYVYNTNAVSAASLNRISALPEDGTKRRTDFSEPDGQENVNPLAKGQSANFMDILSSQMAMSRSKSAMLLGSARQGAAGGGVREADEPEEDSLQSQSGSAAEMADDLMAEQMQEDKADEALTTAAAGGGETGSAMNESAGGSYTSYQMRHALDAYSMAMGFVA